MPVALNRRYPIGAEIIPKEGVHFRVWAPEHKEVTLVLEKPNEEPSFHRMKREKNGYFSLLVPEATKNSLYRFQIDQSERWFSDPASKYQPEGPFGASSVLDTNYNWNDAKWSGVSLEGQIIYEMHLGTFTHKGTYLSAMDQLPELAALGITLIELMPVNDFPGEFGWGYDGVNLFAPCHIYGHPNHLKAFIDKAHSLNMGVILDVVYNHFGPEGNYLLEFSKEYLSEKNHTDWGKAINYDHPSSREFFLTNIRYWIEEYHFDGYRFDATPWIFSSTPTHVLAEMTAEAKKAAGKRSIITIGENEPQDIKLLKNYEEGGYGFDAMWNDDFHHTACVRLTGKREAYYTDYLGSCQEFISSLKYGFLYQGQYYDWQKQKRGVYNKNYKPASLVIFLENHDQIANSGHGERLNKLSDPGSYKALTCLLLLGPNTPMLFQGQEFGSSKPFHYFADHSANIKALVKKGRKEELSQFPRLATKEAHKALIDPGNPLTFTECKLDLTEREKHAHVYALHRDLIKLRKEDPVFKMVSTLRFDGAILGPDSFLIRYFGNDEDRLMIINFGPDHHFNPAPEPLLVAGVDQDWEMLWSSESIIYGGQGTPPINTPYWKILGHSAIVLKSVRKK